MTRSSRPVLSGRAPLRHVPGALFSWTGRSRPVLSGRAPLRPAARFRTGRVARRSSRPQRTGSIAAVPALARSDTPRCVVPSSADGLHCGSKAMRNRNVHGLGRPVLSGRAPLRQVDVRGGDSELKVVPSSADGLHCGRKVARALSAATIVVPSSADGLHCGQAAKVLPEPERLSSRPQRTGSIAACPPWPPSPSTQPGRPVLSGRAPLRPVSFAHSPDRFALSSRPQRTGSIAAASPTGRSPTTACVVPSSADGLHCGWYSRLPKFARASRSSRPQRTGSIAALLRPGAPGGGGGVVPSSADGLHCGGDGDE